MTERHATASVALLRSVSDESGWSVGLIWHELHGMWMWPGGHVEADETPDECAVREVREEVGYHAKLLSPPWSPRVPDPMPGRVLPAPWWVLAEPIPADRATAHPHVHLDHVFVSVEFRLAPSEPETSLVWHPVGQQLRHLYAPADLKAVVQQAVSEVAALRLVVTGS